MTDKPTRSFLRYKGPYDRKLRKIAGITPVIRKALPCGQDLDSVQWEVYAAHHRAATGAWSVRVVTTGGRDDAARAWNNTVELIENSFKEAASG